MNGKPKARPTMVRPGRAKPGVGPRKKLTGNDAIKEYQKSITPKGMAKTKAQQTKAQDDLMVKRYGKKKKCHQVNLYVVMVLIQLL